MEAIAKVIEWLNSPAIPLWLKMLILAVLVVGAVVWLVKPPHWADAEGMVTKGPERIARPPD